MKQETALALIGKYLAEKFDVPAEKVTPEARLFEDLELDSIDALDLAGLLEAEHGMRLDENDLRRIRTVGDIVGYVVANVPDAA